MYLGLTHEQREHVQQFGVPVDSLAPATYWIVSLDAESEMPTDHELRQIRSFCEFKVRRMYLERAAERILTTNALPREPGHNTVIFRKGWGEKSGVWFYRRMTWRDPVFCPNPVGENYRPHTLVELMDNDENLLPQKWLQWKAEHPDLFPA